MKQVQKTESIKTTLTSWPTDDFLFNSTLSGCENVCKKTVTTPEKYELTKIQLDIQEDIYTNKKNHTFIALVHQFIYSIHTHLLTEK